MTHSEALQLLSVIHSAFPNVQAREETVKVYAKLLADIPFDVAQQATMKLLATSRRFPTIAEIRQLATETIHGPVPSAEEAWLEVTRELRRVGSLGEPTFASEITSRVVEAIGWDTLCRSEDIHRDWMYFRQLYEAYAKKYRERRVLPPGLTEPKRRSTLYAIS